LLTVFRTEEREGGILLWRLIMIPKFRAWLTNKYIALIKSTNGTLVSPRMCEVVGVIRHHEDNDLAFVGVHMILRHENFCNEEREEREYKQIEVPEYADLMMSTGMKDVNGKEIYEGDIVRCTVYDGKSMGGYYGGLVEAEGVVEYDFEKAAFVVEGITLSILVEEEEDARTYLEVLGNKYENPELLEKIK
jgi:uncharacterized phage protein (TIGR01671 family)